MKENGYTSCFLQYGGDYICMAISIFFHSCQVLEWGFLVLHFCWKVCNWFPNFTWPQKDGFGVFRSNVPRFFVIISKWNKNCKKWWVLFFFTTWSLRDMYSGELSGNFFKGAHTFLPCKVLISIDEPKKCNSTFLPVSMRLPGCFFCMRWWNVSLITSENQLFRF